MTARRKREGRMVGALIRHVPLRLLDVSASGCLFESPASIGDGSVGQLRVTIDGRHRFETVRVCRSVRRQERAWPWMTGAQFLTLAPSSTMSLRHVAVALGTEDVEDTEKKRLPRSD